MQYKVENEHASEKQHLDFFGDGKLPSSIIIEDKASTVSVWEIPEPLLGKGGSNAINVKAASYRN